MFNRTLKPSTRISLSYPLRSTLWLDPTANATCRIIVSRVRVLWFRKLGLIANYGEDALAALGIFFVAFTAKFRPQTLRAVRGGQALLSAVDHRPESVVGAPVAPILRVLFL